MLSEKAKELKREYMRKWREENREHVQNYNKAWRNEKLKEDPEYFKRKSVEYWERKAENL